MSFVLYTLLQDASEPDGPEAIRAMLDNRFGATKGFSSKFEVMPFTNARSVRAAWDGWSIVFTYDEGPKAEADCVEIMRRLGTKAPPSLSKIKRYIHAFFADDFERVHTTPTVDTMQILESIPGALVYDPQQNALLGRG